MATEVANRPFPKFPKERPILPEAYQKIYKTHYKRNRDGDTQATSISMRLEKWLHKKVADDVATLSKNRSTLEIGAGTLNQLQFEPVGDAYDIIEPFKSLFEHSDELKNIRSVYDDIDEVPIDKKYDRIISVATFEHILDLPKVVAKSILHMNDGATMRTSIPNEGTIMWKLGTMVTGFEFKKMYGLPYEVLMKHEHVNDAFEISEILNYFFEENRTSVFGLNKSLAFYRFIESKKPNIDRAKSYLDSI